MKRSTLGLFLIFFLLLACSLPAETLEPKEEFTLQPSLTEDPALEPPAQTETSEPKLPAEPRRIEFQANDGISLVGYYYPAAVDSAPVVVLMHWANGTHCDWLGVSLVQWLQNRGLPEGLDASPACQNVNISVAASLTQLPSLSAGESYAVFAIDYRGYGESGGTPGKWDRAGWLKDSIAAVQTARTLEGVDSERVIAIGASIGADGAVDGCGEGCLGALSLSPGNYLGISYIETVKQLNAQNKPVWCVAATGDIEAFPVCDPISGTRYQKFVYGGNAHGMDFFMPGTEPKIGQVIYDFLQFFR